MTHPALRRLAAAVPVFLILLAAPAAAEPAAPRNPDGAAIQSVIADQIEAFKRDDGEAAFALASPGVQFKFGDPDTFMTMVRNGYAPVYRPQTVDFETLLEFDGTPVQQVRLVGPDGQEVIALYFMELQDDGSWRISGCTLIEPPGVAV